MEKLNENILRNKEVIIFDLDGTLIDTINIWNKVDYLTLKKYKVNISKKEIQDLRDDFLLNNSNDNIYLNYSKYLVDKYRLSIDYETFYKERIKISHKLLSNIKPKPNVIKTLEALRKRNYLLVIATAASANEIELYKTNKSMRKLFYYFDLIVTADDIKNKKPSPEIYELILKKIRVKKKKLLVIEDSYLGLLSAKNIEIEKVYLENKYSKKDYESIKRISEYKLKNYLDFLRIINNL